MQSVAVVEERCSTNLERTSRAALPWYDFDEIRWATDELWEALAERLRACGLDGVPAVRSPSEDYERDWHRPDLLFSQCCGYDAVLPLRRVVRLVATPCYLAPGCHGPTYTSLIVVRRDSPCRTLEDLRGARAVINDATSHSGMNALRERVAPLSRDGRFFGTVRASGGHSHSLRMVCAGEADVAAIDCVVIEILRRHQPQALRGIRAIARTAPAPAPPYVTRASLAREDRTRLWRALRDVIGDPRLAAARAALLLGGVERVPLAAYRPMAVARRRARALGYREMEAATAT